MIAGERRDHPQAESPRPVENLGEQQREARRASDKRYRQSAKGRLARAQYQVRYRQTEGGRAAHARARLKYERSEKGRAMKARYEAVKGYLTRRTKYLEAQRGRVLAALEANKKEQAWLLSERQTNS